VKILVTNDDGVLAPGLRTLCDVAGEFGDVTVVAPEVERSGVSHAITLTRPLRVQEVEAGWHALSGTPADCVFIGMNHVMKQRPDMVLAGVNRGPNLGFDVIYSGTVGGAMEGTIQGVPAIAFSLVSRDEEYPYDLMAPQIRAVLAQAVKTGIPTGSMLNVNIPAPGLAGFAGFKVTRLGHRRYSNDIWERKDPRQNEYLWIGGTRVTMEDDPATDCGAIKLGFVTITPLTPNVMAVEAVDALDGFNALEVPSTRVRGISERTRR